jgi:hypothetical protein
MRKLALLVALLFSAGIAAAQSTNLQGQVLDTAGTAWATLGGGTATVTATFVPSPSAPNGPYTWTGGTFFSSYSGVINATGFYSINLPSNTAISPFGSMWQISVCPAATANCYTNQPVSVTGAGMTLNITPPAINISLQLPFAIPPTAYNTNELTGAQIFSQYYNLTSSTAFLCIAINGTTGVNCTNWIPFGGSGGGGVPGVFPRWDQLLDPTVNHTSNFSNTVFNFVGGTWNFGTMTLRLPSAASFTGTVTAQIGYDTLNNNLHFYSTADSIVGLFPSSTTFVNGDVASIVVNGNQISLTDTPVNGSSATNQTSVLEVNVVNPVIGQSFCIDSVTGSAYTVSNCSVGVPIDLETASYTVDPINDRGAAIVSNAAGATTVSYTSAFSPSTNFDANWFNVNQNKGAGTVTYTLTAPTIFDSTGTQTETLLEGQACAFLSDDSAGIVYPKCHEPRLIAGSNITFSRTPYSLTIAASLAGGGLSGGGTAGTVAVWTGASALGNSAILDNGTNAARDNNGYDVNSLGAYLFWVTNNAVTGTTVQKMVCNDGSGAGIICSHLTAATNDPWGAAIAANGAAPGTTGSTGVCIIGFCKVIMDNAANAGHYAQSSTSVDGDLSDVGATLPTNSQNAYYIAVGNAGAGTAATIRVLTPTELSIATGSGAGKPVKTVASGTNALGTSAIASGACGTATTSVATGALTTDNVMADFNADPTSTTGYQAGAMLTIVKWVSANQVNFKQCNNTGSSITPAAVTVNWRVLR